MTDLPSTTIPESQDELAALIVWVIGLMPPTVTNREIIAALHDAIDDTKQHR